MPCSSERCFREERVSALADSSSEPGLIAYLAGGTVAGLFAALVALLMGPLLWGDAMNFVLAAPAGLGTGLAAHALTKRHRVDDLPPLRNQVLLNVPFQVAR